ncbi:MAG: ABC transporter ATP-binding protein/permease, partial [Oscillospiraceae bacterium]|nr:ABC transporter ATP-binding protein/permease [Oscillospiraceae bacterium]
FGSAASAVTVGFFAARIGASFSRRLRGALFSKVESFSMEEINRFSTSSLITRSTNDITQVQMLITMGLMLVVKAPITAVWAITKIAGKGFEWTMVTAGATGFLMVFMLLIVIVVFPKFRRMQSLTDNLTRVARENLTGLRVIRAYNAEGYQDAKFERANAEFTGVQLFAGRAMSLMMPVMTIVFSGLNLLINWIGAMLINNVSASGGLERQMTERGLLFSNMIVFSSYAMQVIMSFMMLVMIFIFLPRASVAAKRINEVLGTRPVIAPGSATEGVPGFEGEVEFRNVSFRYPGAAEDVLRGVSFTAKRGETVAFIGSTGSGKSTLINLVPRFFDATGGEVLIGGVNVRDYTLETLYGKIGYVPQKAVMFRGTVASNVAYGDNGGGDDAVRQAVAIAQSAEFVEAMENTYGADVAQDGTNLSGGQKQRLSIARAVCRKPEVYIFDDSFSALDYRTDRLLRNALKRETAGVTSLIVAQRVGTVMDADRIVVLDEGRVVGIGTHKELLQTCAVYKEIAVSQLSEEELAS